ncbi:hypothetical protein IEO21_08411 [Rhodonia placenta]|uniref:Uncharacterized protein n=1 Tax=Rhodonia placenta TaxID=104341 RepID=A0A8H7NWC4_9APHY|nr:hypothetical protein IEO21_08411 [Postia placenta]
MLTRPRGPVSQSGDKRSKLRSLGQQRQAYIQGKFRGGCARWSVRSWSVRSMLTRPRGPMCPYQACSTEVAGSSPRKGKN